MKSNPVSQLKTVFSTVIVFVILFGFVSSRSSASTTLDTTVNYNSANNSFTVTLNPDADGQVAFYYKNSAGNVNGLFGEDGEELPAKTCSDVCTEDTVTYAIMKIAIPSSDLLKTIWFKMDGNNPVVLFEELIEDAESNGGSASDNTLLELNNEEDTWLNSPVDITPTPSSTNTPTATITKSPTPSKTSAPTASLTPSPTPANEVVAGVCENGAGWVNSTLSVSQGKQRNGMNVPLYRSSTTYGYGLADELYYTLGMNGTVTYGFAGEVLNEAGSDISIYEVTLGRFSYPLERATVQVSTNGTNWVSFSSPASSRANALGITSYDLASVGLSSIRFIRLTDIVNPANLNPEADGFDINAIQALNQQCAVTVTPSVTPSLTPTNTPTVTPSLTPTNTPTLTPTLTPTNTPTNTPSPTITPSPTNTPINAPPVVDAGEDQIITLPGSAVLSATVSDDGLPNPPGTINTSWELVDGTGIIEFIDPDPLSPEISFTDPGLYILKFTATDSELIAEDTVEVFVNPEPSPTPTETPTPTLTPSLTPTATPTNSPTPTVSPSPTFTPSPTPTNSLPNPVINTVTRTGKTCSFGFCGVTLDVTGENFASGITVSVRRNGTTNFSTPGVAGFQNANFLQPSFLLLQQNRVFDLRLAFPDGREVIKLSAFNTN